MFEFNILSILLPLQSKANHLAVASLYILMVYCDHLKIFATLDFQSTIVATFMLIAIFWVGLCKGFDALCSLTGEPNSSLVYDSGELSLSYYNGRGNCRGSFNRTTTIRFVCDHSKSVVGDGPEFVATFEDCSYVFTWLTSLACPTVEVHACTVTDPITKDRYDLSGLELSGANYEKQFGNVSYIINICRSLVHKNGKMSRFLCLLNHEYGCLPLQISVCWLRFYSFITSNSTKYLAHSLIIHSLEILCLHLHEVPGINLATIHGDEIFSWLL